MGSQDSYNYELNSNDDQFNNNNNNTEYDDELFNEKPDLSMASIRHYFATRLTTLLDLPLYHTDKRWYQVINPIPGLKLMTASDWNFMA